jgi:hypothetical protein
MTNTLNMSNNSWWKGMPVEIEIDLEILSDLKNLN